MLYIIAASYFNFPEKWCKLVESSDSFHYFAQLEMIWVAIQPNSIANSSTYFIAYEFKTRQNGINKHKQCERCHKGYDHWRPLLFFSIFNIRVNNISNSFLMIVKIVFNTKTCISKRHLFYMCQPTLIFAK